MDKLADVAPVKHVVVDRVCRECGKMFEAPAMEVNGRVAYGATVCTDCGKAKPRPARIPADVRPAMESLGINMREHGHMALDDIRDAGGSSEAAAATMAGWAEAVNGLGRYDWTDGAYLHGPTGTGKSQVAVSTVRYVLELGLPAHTIVYDRARDLATTIQDTYKTGAVDAVLDRRRGAALWVLEDVGSERHTADSFRIMEAILDRRMGWPNVWTSNYSPEGLEEHWAGQSGQGRFSSRLAGFRFLSITGDDRRFTRVTRED